MVVLFEVTVHTVHALFQVDVFQLDGALPFFWVVLGDAVPCGIQQMAAPVFFKDRPEVPTVAVVIGKLGDLQLGI